MLVRGRRPAVRAGFCVHLLSTQAADRVARSAHDEPAEQSARGHALDQILEALQFDVDLGEGAPGR